MRPTDEKIKAKFETLLSEGRRMLQQCGWNGRQYESFPNIVDFTRWRTQAINLDARLFMVRRLTRDEGGEYLVEYTDVPNRIADGKTATRRSDMDYRRVGGAPNSRVILVVA